MKCLKCNSSVKKSTYSGFNGYETFRCTECNALFEIRDFKDQLTQDSLIKPEFKYNHMGKYFDELIREGSVRVPMGAGKSLMLEKIAANNPQVLIIVASKVMVQNFNRKDSETKTPVVELTKFIHNIEYYQSKYSTLIIDEQYPSRLRRLQDAISDKWDKNKVYYINHGI